MAMLARSALRDLRVRTHGVRPRLPLFTLREGSEEGRAYLPQRRVPQRVFALVRARVLQEQVQGT